MDEDIGEGVKHSSRRRYASASVYFTSEFDERFWQEFAAETRVAKFIHGRPKVVESAAAFVPVLGNAFTLIMPQMNLNDDEDSKLRSILGSAHPKFRQEALDQTGEIEDEPATFNYACVSRTRKD